MIRRASRRSFRAGGDERWLAQFRPTFLSGCVLWLRADLGITLGGTLKATGTAPPVVTISGTPAALYGLHIEIDNAGGARGTATFKWSLDNGASYQATGVLTAATTVLGATGITVAWPVGTYNADNKYDGTVSQWNDQSGAGNHVLNVTAPQQPVELVASAAMGARPSLQFTAASAMRLVNAGFNALNSLAGATLLVVAKDSTESNEYIYGTIPMRAQLSAAETTCRVTDVDFVSAGSAAPTTKSVFESTYDGTLIGNTNRLKAQINGGTVFANSAGVIPATLPVTTGLTVGAYDAGAAPFEQEIAEMVIYTRALSAAERSRVRKYMGARYGIAVA